MSSETKSQGHRIRNLLISNLVLLAVFHVASVVIAHNASGTWLEIAPKFDLDNEFNVPTVYSGILWGIAAFLSFTVFTKSKTAVEKAGWALLGALFFYISFDEQMVLHESMAAPIRSAFSISNDSILYHAWVIPAILITALLAGIYIFIKSIPKASATQKRVYKYVVVLGAGIVTLEALGTLFYVSPVVYKLGPVMIEELFEVSMASFIIYRLYQIALAVK